MLVSVNVKCEIKMSDIGTQQTGKKATVSNRSKISIYLLTGKCIDRKELIRS